MKKQCTKCKRELPATKEYFYTDKRGKNGLRSKCKQCCKEYTKQWRKRNRKKYNEYKRQYEKQWYKTIKGYLGHIWGNINQRCYDPKIHNYRRYGGRGVKNRFENLDEFRDYVMNTLGYDTYDKIKGLQIDRINNDGHYEKGNIRFVTPKVNANNK